MTVKGNMPTLYRQLKKLPWAAIPAVSAVSTDHGRRARRTIKAALAPAWIGFAGAAQVAQLRRTVTKKGKKTVEVVYLITSDRDAEPGHPGRLGPRPLGDREQAPLGPRRHLPGRQIPGQNRERAPRDGNAAQPGHQPPAPGRPRQHRRRQPPPRPRPAADAQATSDRMNDFAASLMYPCPACRPPQLPIVVRLIIIRGADHLAAGRCGGSAAAGNGSCAQRRPSIRPGADQRHHPARVRCMISRPASQQARLGCRIGGNVAAFPSRRPAWRHLAAFWAGRGLCSLCRP